MNWTCELAAQKVKHIPGGIKRRVASRSREVILLLHRALVSSHVENCTQLWNPQHRKDMDILQQVQRRDTKIRVLEHLCYEGSLKELFSLEREGSGMPLST